MVEVAKNIGVIKSIRRTEESQINRRPIVPGKTIGRMG